MPDIIAEGNPVVQVGSGVFSTAACAKLNITLSIGKKESNGMHGISSTMQTVSLHDIITLDRGKKPGFDGFMVKDNLMGKALDALATSSGRRLDCGITLRKSIPMAAGLGGGSSDAAAVLRLANEAFELGMHADELSKIAETIGSDVPFLIRGGRALVHGENQGIVEPVDSPGHFYVIANPQLQLSTKEMYALHDVTGKDFTELASELCSSTGKLLQSLEGASEKGVTGKGPTVFAAYGSYEECRSACESIAWFKGNVFIERSVSPYQAVRK